VNRLIRLMAVCCVLIPFAAAQSSPASNSPRKPLTIEAIFAPGGITGRPPETLQWTPDYTKFSFIQRDDSGESGELWSVDAATGEKKLLVSESKLSTLAPPVEKIRDEREIERITRYHVDPYHWAPDSQHLLFVPHGQLWLYSLGNGTALQLSSSPDPISDPKFSPDGRRLAYLRKHNLYVFAGPDNTEKQLTRNKDKEKKNKDKDEKANDDNLLNGEVDWVYAEELGVRSNYFWSPDGKSIAFLRMDETRVPTYPITNWLFTHPTVDMEKYPKAGDPNPVVRLGVVSASGGDTKWISLTEDHDIYIPRFGWIRDGLLWAEVLNRAQDVMDLYFIDARSGRSRKVLTEATADAWVNVNDDMRILGSGDRFVWSSWRDGTTQLYLYSFDKANPLAADAKLERQLTKGDFVTLGVEAVDDAAGVVYFNCNQDDPRQRQLYAVKLDGSGFQRISHEDGTHHVTFADNGRHYVDEFSALMTPPRTSICNASGSCRKIWDSNSVDDYGLITPKFLEFKADDGTILYGELLLPSESTAANEIPVIVNIYGGPAGQTVTNSWIQDWIGSSGLFHQIMAQQGFAIFTVDNRGTPGRDRKFMTAVRHQFGAIELKDQLTALDQLFAQYPQLDRARVGIWGWSNGASLTLYAMAHSNLFTAGAAVAPVTDWRNYDSIYTERNNGKPTDKNTTSYVDFDPPKIADKLQGALLIAHGTGDDNVHLQNSIQMVEALIKAGKQFRFMVYPTKTHSIRGPEDRTHLFQMIEDHFESELK
jgi:dipeptidyl-peptidase-4